jgi:hypothetical protein
VSLLVEILPVVLSGGAIRSLRPPGAASWQVSFSSGADPGPVVAAALSSRGLRAGVLHSTSWRHEHGHLVLTYIAVLDADPPPSAGLAGRPDRPGAPARGGATTAPAGLRVDQVLDHALRHLAWLHRDDPAVAAGLDPAWGPALAGLAPAPFQALLAATA